MSPTPTLTFYGWGTAPRNHTTLPGPHGTAQSQRKCLCCPQTPMCSILLTGAKKNIFTKNYLKKKVGARFMFFPTEHPYSWTTGASELIISSLWAFTSSSHCNSHFPDASYSPVAPHEAVSQSTSSATWPHSAAPSACDPIGPIILVLLGLLSFIRPMKTWDRKMKLALEPPCKFEINAHVEVYNNNIMLISRELNSHITYIPWHFMGGGVIFS